MFTVVIPEREFFDETGSRFVKMEGGSFEIEHSLAAVAKWEARHGTPFFSMTDKTADESVDYIRCMTVTPDVNPDLYNRIDNELMAKINDYIATKQTATTIKMRAGLKKKSEIITAEVVYYWMITLGIPSEYDQWHMNRLFTLIEVFNDKSGPQKKMKQKDILAQNRALNEARKTKYKTKG